ncbi:MAG: Mur ligase family protein, partial [Hyphomicrobium sp.]
MLLTELLADLPGVAASAPAGSEAIRITGVTSDSRAVESGFVFVAVPGVKADGGSYVADAVRRGAVAVVVEASSAVEVSAPVAVVRVGNTRRTLAALAAAFYRGQPETVVAVTGTSGKTSVAEFTRQIFAALGKKSASLGTLGVMTDAGLSEGALTTPGPVELHKMLAGLARDGVTHLAMEASSHGLD